ncbi:MAG: cation transporter [Chitinophagales bacterium]|nr:cation transporter [Chitinophagales bacterium]
MKTLKIVKSTLFLALIPFLLFAQTDKKKTETIYIQTSAQCDECKSKIEGAVKDLKGVKDAQMNMADMKLMVSYSPNKVNADEIKNAISKSGYDADNVMADKDSYNSLPKCCQKSGGKH